VKLTHHARTEVCDGRVSVVVEEDERAVWVWGFVDGEWVVRATAARRDDALRAAMGAARLLRELVAERGVRDA